MEKKKEEKNWYLYLTAATVNLTTLEVGSMLSWSSPSLQILKENSADNPLGKPLTTHEIALIASLLSIGAFCSSLLSATLADIYGRKRVLLIASSTIFVSYLLIAFADEVWQFYTARFIGGLLMGVYNTIIPNYVGEISQKHNRGMLISFNGINICLGKLLMFCIGPFLTIQQTSLIFLAPGIIFVLIFSFIPESPYYLCSKGKELEAKAALAIFRRQGVGEIEEEFNEIKAFVKQSFEVKGGFLDIYRNKSLFKMLGVVVGLIFFQQFSGALVIIFYMQGIFESAGSTLSPAIASIIIGIVQLIATFLPSFLVDRAGRRILLSMVAIGIFFVLRDRNISTDGIFWLPIVSLVVFVIGYNIGIAPVTYVMLGELFPPHVKAIASTVVIAVFCASTAITTTIFPYLVEAIGQGETFWCFGACSFVGIFFIYFLVPETKGKSLSEINQSVNKL